MANSRREAERLGRRAEALCVIALRLKGYAIVARNVRTPRGEIDIVARRSGTLVFVEVKARATAAQIDALSPRQRRRLIRAADAFRAGRPRLAELTVRFDLMLAVPWRWPKHIADAWRADDP